MLKKFAERKLLRPGVKLVRHFLKKLRYISNLCYFSKKRIFFLPYASSHLLCGKLVCAWPHKELVSRANLSVIYTHVREEMCVSTYRNQNKANKNPWTTIDSPEERDDTFVEDGSVCGPDMVIRTTTLKVF